MNKLRSQYEGLAIVLAIATANLARETLMTISGNLTADKAGADDIVLGRLVVPAKVAGDNGTIETRFKERIEIKASGAIAAGQHVKMAADDVDGNQRVTVWDPAVDTADTKLGLCIKGGADAATVEILTY